MPRLRLLLIDDHPIVCVGLRRTLEQHADLQIVGEAYDGLSALQQADRVAPDVALCDLRLPGMDGLAVIRALRQRHPRCGILVFTMSEDDEVLVQAIHAGAAAFATKGSSSEALVALIRQVGTGRYPINEQVLSRPPVAAHLLATFQQVQHLQTEEGELFMPLTRREAEILEWVARGSSNKEIAQGLAISDQTVKNHMSSVLRKLAVNGRTQAVLYAVRRGWIRLEPASGRTDQLSQRLAALDGSEALPRADHLPAHVSDVRPAAVSR